MVAIASQANVTVGAHSEQRAFMDADKIDRSRSDDGSKMGINATRKWPAEGFISPWPEMLRKDAATKYKVNALWSTLGL
jgi:3-polyprenyl-4-hydroxybenzoate decarboxylase